MKKLGIIGAGSSGLITLKTALEHLKGWEITCFEKSNSIQGCWGNPYPDFISTSTKYTTQFSCFPQFDDSIDPERQKSEFFKGGEYGQYLDDFSEHFQLREHIQLETPVNHIERDQDQWVVHTKNGAKRFHHIIICTGLAEKPKEVKCSVPTLKSLKELPSVSHQSVVIMGGGESAADVANRLAQPERCNRVFLSLKGGIRVSPRYHPIRGVPSDFLRNRLMLSISQKLRNKIGQRFVESRIKYQELFQKLFPHKRQKHASDPIAERRKEWDFRLTKASKDNLFNMFHNKSDGFLEAVGDGRIQIIGEPVDQDYTRFHEFKSKAEREVKPNLLIPMIGYESGLSRLFKSPIHLRDFYLGCTHTQYSTLHLIGFARPIIGNIPSISEQQALFIIKSLSGEVTRPKDLTTLHQQDRDRLAQEFPTLNLEALYPVEMFPYCDTLARLMGTFPTRKTLGWKGWLNMQLSPASTLHYTPYKSFHSKVYTPPVLNALLSLIKLTDKLLHR